MESNSNESFTSTAASSSTSQRRKNTIRPPVAAPFLRERIAPSPLVTSALGTGVQNPTDGNAPESSEKVIEVPKRKSNPWSFEDVSAFYEGIKIHGKDFDSVVKVMAKRKVEKTKEHAKVFFFNSAKAYKQMLSLSDDDLNSIPRDARELFLLVNACEWKRKTSNMKMNPEKLKELVYDGSVNVRVGKKFVRIRTPPCPALCRYFSCRKAEKIPSELFVHLEPTSNGDHTFVRNRNYNPFLRVKLNTNDRISKLLEFLQKKWAAANDKSALSVTLWPDSSCEVASLSVHTVETSPFISLSMNKLKKHLEDVKDRTDPKKPAVAGVQMAAEVNTKSKPNHTVYYPRPFTLTDKVLAEGITHRNITSAIMAELFCVCGRSNPIQLRYQISYEQPDGQPAAPEPWRVMIDLLKRGYGEALTNCKKEEEKDRRRGQREAEMAYREPAAKKKRATEELPPPSASTSSEPAKRMEQYPVADIVRQENEDFASQLAMLRKTQRQKTVSSKRKKSAAPVLSTNTPPISMRPPVTSPATVMQPPQQQIFVAPMCTIIPRRATMIPARTPVRAILSGQSQAGPSTSGPPKLPTDFSSVVVSPKKTVVDAEQQRKWTDDFLSSLRTPVETPVQTPMKPTMQQLFGDDLSMSPSSTRHASHLEAPEGANSSVVDFTDMMYQHIKDNTTDITMSNQGLQFSVTEVHEVYDDMMCSSQNSHDYILQQFEKKKITPKRRK
ncbi:unnamed protein product [Caenorhabditis sp. 36 PRJEB53466]|nr:unnamed protein product [Caenorhabditis sp. 36 PRJEB53466]